MTQTFDARGISRILINDISGAVVVRGWDQPIIQISHDHAPETVEQRDETLLIEDGDDDISLMVPYAINISITEADDVHVEHIQGTVSVERINGDLSVKNVTTLQTAGKIAGDASISEVVRLDLQRVEKDLTLQNSEQATIGSVGKDFHAQDFNVLQCTNIGGDCSIKGQRESRVTLSNVGKDLTVQDVSQLKAEKVGKDASIRDIQGDVEIRMVGKDLVLRELGGALKVHFVGNDASLQAIHGSIDAGNIGHDLQLQADFTTASVSHLRVGHDASIILDPAANLTIQAVVSGAISGRAIVTNQKGNRVTLVYGEGAAKLDLLVGKDLHLGGQQDPRSSNSTGGNWWSDFAHDIADFGREMGNLGRDLGADFASASGDFEHLDHPYNLNDLDDLDNLDLDARHSHRNRDARRRQEDQEKLQKAREKLAGINIRLNEREWRMDSERINHIIEEAQRATTEGIQGAREAIEQAFSNLHITHPTYTPTPPTPPMPPTPPQTPAYPAADTAQDVYSQANLERVQPEVPLSAQNETATTVEKTNSAPVQIEQEREAILRMIATGRLTPEEGDMLLEALGN
ncbi:hypothetical protein [Dictyobacter arantiisoli]|uniref:Uncharacterized protein n=1 Tax=Dictyobacter arantiisoli TaxID=2014874 RepID=A0A5A5TG04_9CHLR|nr:hypothetical protein [Dictyobacter arantiisoli]GCF10510.1 hypothetical protein KDI_40740 [Dictyobacter arantiisoli]